ncbi:ROK family protein [Listeria costaricensis]|uniref:ROK family protein n=1 Tax=Listeria costaricensis TaxID=2026604 RepID=UPI000C08AE8F|nr:ROK family protein [Listeria costaricensis]
MYMVFDIGGTFVKFARMNGGGIIQEKGKFPTNAKSPEELIAQMTEKFEQYKDAVKGIAVSCPGIIDAENGIVYYGGSLTFMHKQHLAERLSVACGVPVVIQNDAKCAALAELWLGTVKGYQNAVVLTLGSGVGGGIILDGKLYSGKNLYAGEVSYMMTGLDKETFRPDFFGMTGSAVRLVERIARAKQLDDLTDGVRAFELINQGDEEACAIFRSYALDLAAQILNIQYLLDPEIIAIGGGISAQPIVVSGILDAVNEIKAKNPFHMARPQIVACKFQNDANLYGALYHYLLHFDEL